MTGTTSAALLLTNRIVDAGVQPLSAGAFWQLQRAVPDLDSLLGQSAGDVAETAGVPPDDARRIVALLGAETAFAFERERLRDEGVVLLSALDPSFPPRLRETLGDACPSFLLVAGPVEFAALDSLAVVGSRDAAPSSLAVASLAAEAAVGHGRAVVSGLARGIDQAAMTAMPGARLVGVPSEGIRTVARNPEVRARVHAGELCLVSPYAPSARFSTGNAMGRNKIVYALAGITLVVCSDQGRGGTWEGAREALRRGYGVVAVWRGEGEGPGNAALVRQGGHPVHDVADLFEPGLGARVQPATQGSLFG